MEKLAKTLVLAATFSALACVAYGQESAEYPYRLVYENSPELPDGIAFHMTLSSLNHSYAETGGTSAVAQIVHELGLDYVETQNFISRALTTLELIESEVFREITSHSCRFAGAKVSKKDKYAALQATYDIYTRIYNRHYAQFKGSLPSDQAEMFQRWIDEQKLSIGHYEVDFELAAKQTGRDLTETLKMLCARPVS